jgi:hypothetical protein
LLLYQNAIHTATRTLGRHVHEQAAFVGPAGRVDALYT